VRTSWYLTNLLHRFPDMSEFDQRAQEYELHYLQSSRHAQAALAEQYAGLPFESADTSVMASDRDFMSAPKPDALLPGYPEGPDRSPTMKMNRNER
jgi:hypothetical protein